MRKKFTTYIEDAHIHWLKRYALELEATTGRRVSAADVLNDLIEKEIDEMNRPDTSHYQKKVYFYTVISHGGTLEERFQFPTADEAYEAAEQEWSRLVPQDKKKVRIIVGVKEDNEDKPDFTTFAEFPKSGGR